MKTHERQIEFHSIAFSSVFHLHFICG